MELHLKITELTELHNIKIFFTGLAVSPSEVKKNCIKIENYFKFLIGFLLSCACMSFLTTLLPPSFQKNQYGSLSSTGIAVGYSLDSQGSIFSRDKIFFLYNVQTSSGAHLDS
jgi:hypothetical protein